MPLLLVGYVPSCGPAVYVLGWVRWFDAYAPLLWMGQRCQPADAALWWYMDKRGAEFPVPPMDEDAPATQA